MIPNFTFYAGQAGQYMGVRFACGPWARTSDGTEGWGPERFACGADFDNFC